MQHKKHKNKGHTKHAEAISSKHKITKPFLYFNILSIIWQLLLSVKWRHMFSYEVKTGPIYGMKRI
jgi:hypothetical protein